MVKKVDKVIREYVEHEPFWMDSNRCCCCLDKTSSSEESHRFFVSSDDFATVRQKAVDQAGKLQNVDTKNGWVSRRPKMAACIS